MLNVSIENLLPMFEDQFVLSQQAKVRYCVGVEELLKLTHICHE